MTAPAAGLSLPAGGLGARAGSGPRTRPGMWLGRRWRRAPRPAAMRGSVNSAVRRMGMPAAERAARRMTMYGLFVTFGMVLCGRGFAYLGIAPINLYISEITIITMVIFSPTRTYLAGLLRQAGRAGRLHLLAVAMMVFFCYGVAETIRGLFDGGSSTTLLKSLQLYYYPVLLSFGMWMGVRDPKIFSKLVWALAWGNATYGIAYAVFLNKLQVTVPGNPGAPLFDLGLTNAAMAILGLVVYHRRSKWLIPLVLLNVAVLFGHQIRAEWLALIVSLVIYCVLTRQYRRLAAGLGVILVFATVITIINVKIPGPTDRGGAVRPTDVIGRAVGSVDPELASQFTSADRVEGANGTAQFRQAWWHGIWHSATSDPTFLFFGHGYGFNLQTLAPPGNVDTTVRSPHNIIFYSIGYTGFVGVALMALLFYAIARQLWTVYKRTGNPVGLALMALMVTASQFEPFLESPFGAAACYLTLGMCLAPLMRLGGGDGRRLPARLERALAGMAHDRPALDLEPAPIPAQRRYASRGGSVPGVETLPEPGSSGPESPPLRRPAALSAGAPRPGRR
ncbi:O-antigen ligase family protein [Pseudofrankia sp. DC12]|uniref:O-antigen ligase family protein n=1 Tax=Pseudofrankia sp. DC12 TaxID=683315 RepID=UPI0005F77F64|nr:O-antigen ligase family protein [Pseudofrankia sp. DC12]